MYHNSHRVAKGIILSQEGYERELGDDLKCYHLNQARKSCWQCFLEKKNPCDACCSHFCSSCFRPHFWPVSHPAVAVLCLLSPVLSRAVCCLRSCLELSVVSHCISCNTWPRQMTRLDNGTWSIFFVTSKLVMRKRIDSSSLQRVMLTCCCN